jgi:hypothetical protein
MASRSTNSFDRAFMYERFTDRARNGWKPMQFAQFGEDA